MEGRYDSNRMPGNIRREDAPMEAQGILNKAKKMSQPEQPTGLAATMAPAKRLSMEEMVQAGIMSPQEYQMNMQELVAQSEMNARPQAVTKPVGHPELLGGGLATKQVQGLGQGEQVVVDQGFNEAHPMTRGFR